MGLKTPFIHLNICKHSVKKSRKLILQTDRQTDRLMDGQTDRWTECKPKVPSGFAGMGLKKPVFKCFLLCQRKKMHHTVQCDCDLQWLQSDNISERYFRVNCSQIQNLKFVRGRVNHCGKGRKCWLPVFSCFSFKVFQRHFMQSC